MTTFFTAPKPFDAPIYVTRPMLPPLEHFTSRLERVWESEWLTNGGPQHIELEAAICSLLETENVSLFNNGTLALVTACQALRLSGEVITTPFTFPATPHVLSWNNIVPVFADIDPRTMTLDPANIEPLITGRTTGILAVHVYGIPCDVEGLQAVADRHGLRLVYDAAHAFGVRTLGRPITDFGDASMLSFHATKLFHTAEGGALVVRDDIAKKRVDLLKNFGIMNEFTVLMPGINGKMNELQAALGLATLQMVEMEKRKRREISSIYHEILADIPGVVLPSFQSCEVQSFQYFPIRIDFSVLGKNRDYVCDKLKTYNVFARKYFYPLCSEYSCYRMLPSSNPSYLPVAHRVASEVMCLPFFGGLKRDDVYRICEMLLYILDVRRLHV